VGGIHGSTRGGVEEDAKGPENGKMNLGSAKGGAEVSGVRRSEDLPGPRAEPLQGRPVYRPERGPFDVIGDVHGCFLELVELLHRLGYVRRRGRFVHPEGRRAVFLGDLTDRGPLNADTISLVYAMVRGGSALYVPGNHCWKLYRYLRGAPVQVQHGLEVTVRELEALPPRRRAMVCKKFQWLFEQAPPYLVLDEGRLVAAHAGIREEMIGQVSKRIIRFCLYGDVTGERTPDGFPVRRDWAQDYRGQALIVYGHTPVREAVLRHNTINIDQGCVFGGKLTAFRYPEREVVQVPAYATYDPRVAFRELTPPAAGPQEEAPAQEEPETRRNSG